MRYHVSEDSRSLMGIERQETGDLLRVASYVLRVRNIGGHTLRTLKIQHRTFNVQLGEEKESADVLTGDLM